MNLNESEIERLLRRAPKPAAPAHLKETLLERVRLPVTNTLSKPFPRPSASADWLKRWWPAFIPAAASLGCVVILTIQQMDIRDLRESIHTLSKNITTEANPVVTPKAEEVRKTDPGDYVEKEHEEIERLRQLTTRLTSEVVTLEQVQKRNEELRVKLSSAPTFTQEELDELAKMKARAMSINCINNLKQFGLAVRVWAMHNHNVFPPDSLSMSNELNTPKILLCPADTNRVAAKSWQVFSPTNCSYDYLTPSATNADREPTRVLTRCPIHGHIGLCDGSVQGEVAKKHPDWLKARDGKLYMER